MQSSLRDLDVCYNILARIVRNQGEKYLPIFQRIYEEKLRIEANSALHAIALQVAANGAE